MLRNSQSSTARIHNKRAIWGRRFIRFAGTAILLSSVVKFLHPPKPLAYLASMGYEGNTVYLIAAMEMVIAALFLIPATRRAGVLLISAFLGGTVAAHVATHRSFAGGPFITYMAEHPYVGALIPGMLLVLAWLGDYLERTATVLDRSVDRRETVRPALPDVTVGSNS
jgi:hypothetical protein